MSLIYAKKISDSDIFFISDTKFSYDEFQTNNKKGYSKAEEYLGGLKTIIIHGGLVVAFAGEVAFAIEAIEGIYEKDIDLWDLPLVLEYFKYFAVKSNMKTDFLVSAYKENGSVTLHKIVGKAVSEEQVAWIGDEDGFKELQKHRLTNTKKEIETGHSEVIILANPDERQTTEQTFNEISKIMPAFLNVVNGKECKTVSGAITISCTSKIGFKYMEHHILTGPTKPASSGNGGIYFGDASTGSFYMQSGREVNSPVYPVLYDMGKFGVIYSPTRSFIPKVLKYKDRDEFNVAFHEELKEVAKRMNAFPSGTE